MIMYADDTVLMSIGANVYDAQCSSQKILDKYVLWSTTNGLKINVAKTKQMFFNSRNRNQQPLNNICITGGTVTNADTYVYLGVTMDRNLTFEPFLKSIIQKVNYKLYLFGKIRYMWTFAAAILVYKQMVLPFFDYLDILIDSGFKLHIDKLQQLQFRGIKIIYQYHMHGRKITSDDECLLHSELGLEFLERRRVKHLLHMMYDLQYRRPDLIAFSDMNKNIVLRSGSKTVFMYDKLYSDIYVKSPYIRGNTLWKQLPSNIQQAKTKSEFKSIPYSPPRAPYPTGVTSRNLIVAHGRPN